MRVRPYTPDDAGAIASILNHEIEHGVAHFGAEPKSTEDVRAELDAMPPRYPAFVAADESEVLGFCRSSPWKRRGAYAWSVETTVYVRAAAQGRGVGKALYTELFGALRSLGYRTAIGGITLPNDASVALHESMGMRQVAQLPNIGFKHAAWRDVGYWAMDLNPSMAGASPKPPGS
ncbi:MAG: GNAT family N-acetyltransferase [Phycisphaerales bacterium JB059]